MIHRPMAGMTISSQLKHALCAGLLVFGTTAAFGVAGTTTAEAVPPSSVNIKTDWDVYQRPSGTTGNPLGFHVHIDPADVENYPANTVESFHGMVSTLTRDGVIRPREGEIQGRLIRFTIRWTDGKVGVYQGSWFDDGYLRGSTREEGTGRTADWWSGSNNWSLSPAH